jgi:hypothetical protein
MRPGAVPMMGTIFTRLAARRPILPKARELEVMPPRSEPMIVLAAFSRNGTS